MQKPDDSTASKESEMSMVSKKEELEIIYGVDGKSTEFAKKNGHLYMNNGEGYMQVEVSSADSALNMVDVGSLVDLGGGYMKDKNHVYINSVQYFVLVDGADPETFKVLKDPLNKYSRYGMDNKSIYAHREAGVIPGVDYASFQVLSVEKAKDKYRTYTEGYPDE